MQVCRFLLGMDSASRSRIGLTVAVLLAGIGTSGGPATALVFSEPLVYQEVFLGETAFPTSPEWDFLGAGSLAVSKFYPTNPDPVLTGSADHFMVSDTDIATGLASFIDTSAISTLESDLGARLTFENASIAGDGGAVYLIRVSSTLEEPNGLPYAIQAQVGVSTLGVVPVATLQLNEQMLLPPMHFIEATAPLGPTATALIVGGSPFTIDVVIDRNAGTAVASVIVGNQPEVVSPPLSLGFLHDHAIASVGATVAAVTQSLPGPISTEVDLSRFEVYLGPRGFEPVFNLDIGEKWSTPTGSYAAAGAAGTWNQIMIGPNPLLDLEGVPTAVGANLTALGLTSGEAPPSDDRNLFSDSGGDCAAWSVDFSRLPSNGAYRVIIYAAAPSSGETGTLSANGNSHPSLPGALFPSLIDGETYTAIETLVDLGNLNVTGVAPAGACVQVAGLQIEQSVALPEPGLPIGIGVALLWMALWMPICRARPSVQMRPALLVVGCEVRDQIGLFRAGRRY